MSKRKLNTLSVGEKLRLVDAHEHGKTRDELCKEFKVSRSTLYRIIQDKEKIQTQFGEGQEKVKRLRQPEFSELEKYLAEWIKECVRENQAVNGPIIKEKARDFATRLNIEGFIGSNGWLDGFKKRHVAVFTKISEESSTNLPFKAENTECNQWMDNHPPTINTFQPLMSPEITITRRKSTKPPECEESTSNNEICDIQIKQENDVDEYEQETNENSLHIDNVIGNLNQNNDDEDIFVKFITKRLKNLSKSRRRKVEHIILKVIIDAEVSSDEELTKT